MQEWFTWQIWLIAGICLMLLELIGLGFYAFTLGLACLTTAGYAIIDSSAYMQLTIFSISALIFATLITKYHRTRTRIRSGYILGEKNYDVLGTIKANAQGELGVTIDGDWFKLQIESQGLFQEGDVVRVKKFDGITAEVELIKK